MKEDLFRPSKELSRFSFVQTLRHLTNYKQYEETCYETVYRLQSIPREHGKCVDISNRQFQSRCMREWRLSRSWSNSSLYFVVLKRWTGENDPILHRRTARSRPTTSSSSVWLFVDEILRRSSRFGKLPVGQPLEVNFRFFSRRRRRKSSLSWRIRLERDFLSNKSQAKVGIDNRPTERSIVLVLFDRRINLTKRITNQLQAEMNFSVFVWWILSRLKVISIRSVRSFTHQSIIGSKVKATTKTDYARSAVTMKISLLFLLIFSTSIFFDSTRTFDLNYFHCRAATCQEFSNVWLSGQCFRVDVSLIFSFRDWKTSPSSSRTRNFASERSNHFERRSTSTANVWTRIRLRGTSTAFVSSLLFVFRPSDHSFLLCSTENLALTVRQCVEQMQGVPLKHRNYFCGHRLMKNCARFLGLEQIELKEDFPHPDESRRSNEWNSLEDKFRPNKNRRNKWFDGSLSFSIIRTRRDEGEQQEVTDLRDTVASTVNELG